MVGLNCVSSSSSSSRLLWLTCVSRTTEIMASGVSWVRCGGGCCGLSVHSSDGTKWTARVVAGRVEAEGEAQQEQRHRRTQHVHGPRQMTRPYIWTNEKYVNYYYSSNYTTIVWCCEDGWQRLYYNPTLNMV